jgi:hypothetical protein
MFLGRARLPEVLAGPSFAEALAFLSAILCAREAGFAVGGGQSEAGPSESPCDFVALLTSPGMKLTPE